MSVEKGHAKGQKKLRWCVTHEPFSLQKMTDQVGAVVSETRCKSPANGIYLRLEYNHGFPQRNDLVGEIPKNINIFAWMRQDPEVDQIRTLFDNASGSLAVCGQGSSLSRPLQGQREPV